MLLSVLNCVSKQITIGIVKNYNINSSVTLFCRRMASRPDKNSVNDTANAESKDVENEGEGASSTESKIRTDDNEIKPEEETKEGNKNVRKDRESSQSREQNSDSDSKPVTRESPKKSTPSSSFDPDDRNEDKFKPMIIQFNEEKEKFLNMDIDEKRKFYKTREKYLSLQDIDIWPVYYDKNTYAIERKCPVKEEKKYKVREDLNTKISLFRGDITCLEIDAIANAANETLLGGGGVDGAIHRAAGSCLKKECETLGGCDTGEAKITGGYKLPAKYVIHTVGPRGEDPDALKDCYLNSLNLLKEHQLKSIAFPCISTGIFGYPNKKAAKVALQTIREWLQDDDNSQKVDRVILCLFLQKDVDIYHKYLQIYFPIHLKAKVEGATPGIDCGSDKKLKRKKKKGRRSKETSENPRMIKETTC